MKECLMISPPMDIHETEPGIVPYRRRYQHSIASVFGEINVAKILLHTGSLLFPLHRLIRNVKNILCSYVLILTLESVSKIVSGIDTKIYLTYHFEPLFEVKYGLYKKEILVLYNSQRPSMHSMIAAAISRVAPIATFALSMRSAQRARSTGRQPSRAISPARSAVRPAGVANQGLQPPPDPRSVDDGAIRSFTL